MTLEHNKGVEMTAEQALSKSYEHWLENWETSLTGEGKYTVAGCALCNYYKGSCDSCVLEKYDFSCPQFGSPYRRRDYSKPETVGNLAQVLLLIYLSEYGTDPSDRSL